MYKTLYNTVEIHQLCKMLYIPFIGCIKYRFPVVFTTCDNIFINTSGYATMVHGRGCNPHRCTTTFANVEITSLLRD